MSEHDFLHKRPDPNFTAPDLMSAVEGWRVWRCSFNPREYEKENPKLWSATNSDYYWTPRAKGVAECSTCGENIPGENCGCGFYSAKSLEHLMTMHYHQYDLDQYGTEQYVMVLGRIANWGKVLEGSQGWRSQFAYPAKLWVPFEAAHLAKPLMSTYGVPVELKNILGAARGARSPYLAPRRPGA